MANLGMLGKMLAISVLILLIRSSIRYLLSFANWPEKARSDDETETSEAGMNSNSYPLQ